MYRIGYYFEYLGLFLLIPYLLTLSRRITGRVIIAALCVVVMFGVWYRRVAVYNWAYLYPYRSDILHISVINEKNCLHNNISNLLTKEDMDDDLG